MYIFCGAQQFYKNIKPFKNQLFELLEQQLEEELVLIIFPRFNLNVWVFFSI